jgi:wee1-like protein kinase
MPSTILQEVPNGTSTSMANRNLGSNCDETVDFCETSSMSNENDITINNGGGWFVTSPPSSSTPWHNNMVPTTNISTRTLLFHSPPSTRRRLVLEDVDRTIEAGSTQPKTPTSLPHKKIVRRGLLFENSPRLEDDETSLVSFGSAATATGNDDDCIMAEDEREGPMITHSWNEYGSVSPSSLGHISQPPVKNLFRENSYPGPSCLTTMATATECSPIAEEISPTDVSSFPFPSPYSNSTTVQITTPVKSRTSSSTTNLTLPPPSAATNHRIHRSNLPPPTTRKGIPHTRQSSHGAGASVATPSNFQGSYWNNAITTTTPPRPSSSNAVATSVSRFASDFYILHEIGTGSFGTVYKVRSRLDGCSYAIKCVRGVTTSTKNRKKLLLLKEVHALAALSDLGTTELGTLHIVRYHQAWMEDHQLYIQTELCTGSLFQQMKTSPQLLQDERRRYKIMREMSLALELLHRKDMVHLDIKPENIFIRNDLYKLGDFGLVSKVTHASSTGQKQPQQQRNQGLRYQNDFEEGDSRYMSRELLTHDGASLDLTKCDIFSLGATMYEICSGGGSLPPNGPEWHALRDGIMTSNSNNLPHTSYELKRILGDMMHPDPHQRPTAKALLQLRPLLSEDQQKLIIQQNEVAAASRKLAEEEQRLQQLFQQQQQQQPSRQGMLIRRATWDVDLNNRRW